MHDPNKKQIAQLLLCSLLLESCHNPNLGTSKKTSQPQHSLPTSSTRPASWSKTHQLLLRQKPAQAEQKQQIASAQPANEPAPTTQPRQAIPATPGQPPSLTDQTPLASNPRLAGPRRAVRTF